MTFLLHSVTIEIDNSIGAHWDMSKEVAKQYVQNQIVKVSQILEKNIYDKDGR